MAAFSWQLCCTGKGLLHTSRTSVLGLLSFPPRAFLYLVSRPSVLLHMACLQEGQLVLPYCVATGFQGRVFPEGKPSVQELIKFSVILNVPLAKANHIAKLTAEEGQECESLLGSTLGATSQPHRLSPESPTHTANCCKTFGPECLIGTSN